MGHCITGKMLEGLPATLYYLMEKVKISSCENCLHNTNQVQLWSLVSLYEGKLDSSGISKCIWCHLKVTEVWVLSTLDHSHLPCVTNHHTVINHLKFHRLLIRHRANRLRSCPDTTWPTGKLRKGCVKGAADKPVSPAAAPPAFARDTGRCFCRPGRVHC